MISMPIRLFRLALAPMILAAVATGCTEIRTEIVEVPAKPSNPPPDASSGLLGYFDAATKQTTCGNCHIGFQSQWSQTKHADAYATLANNPSSQDFCYGCHTVTENGHSGTEPAGWNVVQAEEYHDVQCENCHGPGEIHVQNPDASQPLASIAPLDGLAACADCHSGTHHGFADEWAQSGHATPVSYPAGRAECISCHTGQGALAAWGVNADYIEKDAPLGSQEGITCVVCHNPHGSENSAQLRFPIDVPDQNTNLCIKCHHKRAAPETEAETLRGPHSPQGPLLLGEGAGWFPPNFDPQIERIRGSHGTTGNPRVCATCHVASYQVTDPASGDHVFSVTGHLFLPIPCMDAQGLPTTDQNCTLDQRNFTAGCTEFGCHADDIAARSAYITANTRIDALVTQMEALLLQPPVAADLDRTDGIFTVADGAWFNNELAKMAGSRVHNPFLIEQLMLATITAINDTYGPLPITVPMSLEL